MSTVEGVPVGQFGGGGGGWDVVMQFDQLRKVVRDDLGQKDWVIRQIPPSAKSLVIFFLGLERGIWSTQL